MRRLLAAALCIILTVTAAVPALAARSDRDITRDFLAGQAAVPTAGNTFGDWEVFALARSGAAVPKGFYAAYLTMTEKLLADNKGKLPGATSNNLRLALALLALGQDLTDLKGYDLTTLIRDTDRVCKTAVMGPTFALLLLNNLGGDKAAEDIYVGHLLDKQLTDGGWALSGQISDPDATAMALQALSFYRKDKQVAAAVQKALGRLSTLQKSDGSYTAWGATAAESISQVIIALCMLDIDLSDSRFVKNGTDLKDALLTYRQKDGSFSHLPGGSYDVMSTQQAMLALESLARREQGLPAVYHITDGVKVDRNFVGLPGKNPVIKVPKASKKVSFSDLSGRQEADAITALASRGILEGMGSGRFVPGGSFNRAQFCAMAVRALSLPKAASAGFSDVPAGQWYTDPVNAAAAFGAVQGVGGSRFAPMRTITLQEAAVLMARLAEQCGMKVQYDANACRNVLSQFSDYRSCDSWALESLAFCFDKGILDSSVLEIGPRRTVTRARAASMMYALLDSALLLED